MTESTEKTAARRDERDQGRAPADQGKGARVGKYGGDDGALEHARAVNPSREDAVVEAATNDEAHDERPD